MNHPSKRIPHFLNQALLGILFLLSLIPESYCQKLSYDDFIGSELIISNRQNSKETLKKEYVVLVSIDGFRHDYAEKYGATKILDLAKSGSKSESFLPLFPSKTFPSHYSIISGLTPSNHGIIGNSFYSKEKDDWFNQKDLGDGHWFGGVPLWTLAEDQGMLSASIYWVACEATIAGSKSTYTFGYDQKVPNTHRVKKIIEWLGLPPNQRPHLITAYFSTVDTAGHNFGPDDERTKDAVLEIDEVIGQLVSQLDQTGLPVTIVLVSDHGMTEVTNNIVLPDLVDLKDAEVIYSIPTMIYQPDSVKKSELHKSLLQCDQFETFLPINLPAHLDLNNPDRVGDIIVYPSAPNIISSAPGSIKPGTHGFDALTCPEMGGICYIKGPRIKENFKFGMVENIHLYPFLAYLLDLQLSHKIDGELRYMKPVLK
ncbi:MAG: alkaline phosphatase family protein [Cyclobacteriaceae bacterium]